MKLKTREICFGALFCALTAVCSQLVLNIAAVPISLNFLAVFLCGALLSPHVAFLSELAYLLLGVAGVPVFSNFGGGIEKLLGPTGGYLVVYPVMALLISWAVKRFGDRWYVLALAMLGVTLLCYATGALWMAHLSGTGFWPSFVTWGLGYLPFDAVKIALCTLLGAALTKRGVKLR